MTPDRYRKLARKRRQRGAAVFIVVMVIMLLTGVGVYAARSTSLVDAAAGRARQAAQTQLVAEQGAIAALAEIGSGKGTVYINAIRNGADDCRVTRDVVTDDDDPPVPCYKMFSSELVFGSTPLLEAASDSAPGSLGGVVGEDNGEAFGLQGNFVVELTEPTVLETPVSGSDVGGTGPKFTYTRITTTTIGQVLPVSDLAACETGALPAAGTQRLRAFMVIGPHEL